MECICADAADSGGAPPVAPWPPSPVILIARGSAVDGRCKIAGRGARRVARARRGTSRRREGVSCVHATAETAGAPAIPCFMLLLMLLPLQLYARSGRAGCCLSRVCRRTVSALARSRSADLKSHASFTVLCVNLMWERQRAELSGLVCVAVRWSRPTTGLSQRR